jgi:hypothetical protein
MRAIFTFQILFIVSICTEASGSELNAPAVSLRA